MTAKITSSFQSNAYCNWSLQDMLLISSPKKRKTNCSTCRPNNTIIKQILINFKQKYFMRFARAEYLSRIFLSKIKSSLPLTSIFFFFYIIYCEIIIVHEGLGNTSPRMYSICLILIDIILNLLSTKLRPQEKQGKFVYHDHWPPRMKVIPQYTLTVKISCCMRTSLSPINCKVK